MTKEENAVYLELLKEVETCQPNQRPNRLMHLEDFLRILNLKDKEEYDLFS